MEQGCNDEPGQVSHLPALSVPRACFMGRSPRHICPVLSWGLPAGGVDVRARAGPAGSGRGLCSIPEEAGLAFVALWPLGVVLTILRGRGEGGSVSVEQPSTLLWGHAGPDGLLEAVWLRLPHHAGIAPLLCRQWRIQLHPDEELITSHGSPSHRRFQVPALYWPKPAFFL